MPTKISWTDEVWNPVTGCTPVSPACDNCYARAMHGRFHKTPFSDVVTHPDRLEIPLHWKKPRRIFLCSMGDLFHPRVPWEFIDKVFGEMWRCEQHTFQVLTKRPGRMAHYANKMLSPRNWPSNVWAGVSIPNAQYLPWLDVLARVPAPVRFMSYEPALGPVDLTPWLLHKEQCCAAHGRVGSGSLVTRPLIHWVIAGGESGPKARPMNIDWVRTARDACQDAGVPFFYKQAIIDGKRIATPELDGRRWTEFPDAIQRP